MSTIDELAGSFAPVTLEQMEAVRLSDRIDTKYVFHVRQLNRILEELKPDYYILETGGIRNQHYDTRYFDTPQRRCYLDHHNKRLNRFKIRSRQYVDSGITFFEIKMKTNKGRSKKVRSRQPGDRTGFDEKAIALLREKTGLYPADLIPSLRVDFTRITLTDKGLTERITIDTGLTVRSGERVYAWPDVVIAEVKQSRSQPSLFRQILGRHAIREMRISKYCLGIATLNPTVKRNYFKEKLHIINKIQHVHSQTDFHSPVIFAACDAR